MFQSYTAEHESAMLQHNARAFFNEVGRQCWVKRKGTKNGTGRLPWLIEEARRIELRFMRALVNCGPFRYRSPVFYSQRRDSHIIFNTHPNSPLCPAFSRSFPHAFCFPLRRASHANEKGAVLGKANKHARKLPTTATLQEEPATQ